MSKPGAPRIPDPAAVLDLIDAFRRSKALFTAVSLGVFDSLPATVEALASRLGAHPEALERLLDACVGLGFLAKDAGVYANLPVADMYLRSSSPGTLAGYILYSDEALFRLWANLADAVREGSNRWQQTFGGQSAIFSHFFATPERTRAFLRGMHGFGLLSSPRIAAAFDLGRFRTLVDLGGATGHFAMAACERYPQLRATVFDLPRVVDFARAEAPQSRVAFLAGDFFADPLPPADLYYAGRILHDWSEEKVRLLAAKVCSALPPGGAFLIGEKLLDEDKTAPVPAAMQSLNMLVCTEGRERSASEYRALLLETGFGRVEARRTGAPLDAVLAEKS